MREIIENIFGVYTPTMTDVLDDSGEVIGQVVASGLAGVDWSFIAGVVCFCIVLYGLIHCVGVLLRG